MGFTKMKARLYGGPTRAPVVTRSIEMEACYECGATGRRLVLHHVDGNADNNLVTNLEPLCWSCHVWKQGQLYMYIHVRMPFDAAHSLEDYDGKCARLHGHRWWLSVKLGGRLNKQFMVCDFTQVKKELKEVLERLDHYYLNDVLEWHMPTCEWLLAHLFAELNLRLKGLKEIELSETDENKAAITDAWFLDCFGHKGDSNEPENTD